MMAKEQAIRLGNGTLRDEIHSEFLAEVIVNHAGKQKRADHRRNPEFVRERRERGEHDDAEHKDGSRAACLVVGVLEHVGNG